MNNSAQLDQNDQIAIENFLRSKFATPVADSVTELHLETLAFEAARLRRKQRSRSGRTTVLAGIAAAALIALVIVDQREPTFTTTDNGPASVGAPLEQDRASDGNADPADPSDRDGLEISKSTFSPDVNDAEFGIGSKDDHLDTQGSDTTVSRVEAGLGGNDSTTVSIAQPAAPTATGAGPATTEASSTTPTSGDPRPSSTPGGPTAPAPTTTQAPSSTRRTTTSWKTTTTWQRTTIEPATTERTTTTFRTTTTSRPTTTRRTTTTTRPTSTARPTTTRSPTTTIYIPGPVGVPFQEKFFAANLKLNLCMLNSGYFMVGVPGESDHPLTSDPFYTTAFSVCDATAGLRVAVTEHIVWEVQLNPAQKSFTNDAMRSVFDCAKGKGWDFGELQLNLRGLLWLRRFPPVTETQMLDGTYLNDLASCGVYDLQLG